MVTDALKRVLESSEPVIKNVEAEIGKTLKEAAEAEKLLSSLFGVEASAKEKISSHLEALKANLTKLGWLEVYKENDYRLIDKEIFGLRHCENSMPIFGIFPLDDDTMTLNVGEARWTDFILDRWENSGKQELFLDERSKEYFERDLLELSKKNRWVVVSYYKDVFAHLYRKWLEKGRKEGRRWRGTHQWKIEIIFPSHVIIPPQKRKKIKKAIKYFGDNIFLLVETTPGDWIEKTIIKDPDPLVLAWNGEMREWILITSFDLHPTEKYLEMEFTSLPN